MTLLALAVAPFVGFATYPIWVAMYRRQLGITRAEWRRLRKEGL